MELCGEDHQTLVRIMELVGNFIKFVSDVDEINKVFTPWFSFCLISLRLCADPKISKFCFNFIPFVNILLLNDGKYIPSQLSLIANFKSLDKKNLIPFSLQYCLTLIISG